MNIFYLLVITHFIADFMLQGDDVAVNKRYLNKQMIRHALIMTAAFIIVVFNFPISVVLTGSVVVFFSHAFIDAVRVEIIKAYKISPSNHYFWVLLGVDQILHISVLYFMLQTILST